MEKTAVLETLADVVDVQVTNLTNNVRAEVSPEENIIRLIDNGQAWEAHETYKSALRHLGVGASTINRLSATTASQMVTELLCAPGRSTALVRGHELVGLAPKGRYKSLPVEMVMDTVEDVLGDVDYFRALQTSMHTVRLEIVGQEEKAVEKGDIIRAGVLVEFSPIGLIDPKVQSYGSRLVCTNGMTSLVAFSTHVMTEDVGETRDWLVEAVENAYNGLGESVNRYRDMRKVFIKPSDRALILSGLAKEAGLSGPSAAALFAKATEEPPENAYDVLNIMTWLTSHVLENPQRIVRAQNASARFATEAVYHKHCPTCRRAGG